MLVSRIPRQAYVASCADDFKKWPLHALAAEYARVKADYDVVSAAGDEVDVGSRIEFGLEDFVADPNLYPAAEVKSRVFRSRADVQTYFFSFGNLSPHFQADKLRGLATLLEHEEKRYEALYLEGYFDNAAHVDVLWSRLSVIEEFICCSPCSSLEDAAVKLRFATEHLTNMDCDWDQRDLVIKSVLSFLGTLKQDNETSTGLQVAALEAVAEQLG